LIFGLTGPLGDVLPFINSVEESWETSLVRVGNDLSLGGFAVLDVVVVVGETDSSVHLGRHDIHLLAPLVLGEVGALVVRDVVPLTSELEEQIIIAVGQTFKHWGSCKLGFCR